MKKYLIFLLILISSLFLSGCNLGNTPTSKVEDLLTKYQTLDKDIELEIGDILANETLTNDQKKRYKKLLTKQYQNLSYEIKDEIIDGNESTVKVEIEVLDYKKALAITENEYAKDADYSIEEYNNTKLSNLEKVKDKVIYTLEFMITKDNNGNWKLNALTNVDKQKLQGMY